MYAFSQFYNYLTVGGFTITIQTFIFFHLFYFCSPTPHTHSHTHTHTHTKTHKKWLQKPHKNLRRKWWLHLTQFNSEKLWIRYNFEIPFLYICFLVWWILFDFQVLHSWRWRNVWLDCKSFSTLLVGLKVWRILALEVQKDI